MIQIAERLVWSGRISVVRFDLAGREIGRDDIPNLITDVGLNYLRDILDGTIGSSDTAIKYIAPGTSNTAPANGQTQLGNEVFRKAVTKQETPATGQLKTTVYIAPYEANQQIEEIGVFAGPNATASANTGVMIARVLYSRLKTNLESWNVERIDTLARV